MNTQGIPGWAITIYTEPPYEGVLEWKVTGLDEEYAQVYIEMGYANSIGSVSSGAWFPVNLLADSLRDLRAFVNGHVKEWALESDMDAMHCRFYRFAEIHDLDFYFDLTFKSSLPMDGEILRRGLNFGTTGSARGIRCYHNLSGWIVILEEIVSALK